LRRGVLPDTRSLPPTWKPPRHGSRPQSAPATWYWCGVGGGGSSTTLTRVSTLVETAVCREWGRRARGGSPTAGYGRRGRTRSPSSVSHQVRDIVCCPPTESYW